MTTRQANACVLALLVLWAAVGAVAQDRSDAESNPPVVDSSDTESNLPILDPHYGYVCGAEWITFILPGISEDERQKMNPAMALANRHGTTLLTIPKRNVRNLVFFSAIEGSEVVFFLETGSAERPRVFYSGLVSLRTYQHLVSCLD